MTFWLTQWLGDLLINYGNLLQNEVYKIAKDTDFDMKSWFSCIYKTLLGQEQGPRVGSFIALFGTKNMAKLIEEKIKL